MKRLLALLLFAVPCLAQTFSGPITAPLTYTANQVPGGTNLVFVSYCYQGCSGTPAPASDIASVTDAAGDSYIADYAFTGLAGGATFVFRASNVAASSANAINVAIPSSTSSVMMVSLFPQNWIPDAAANAGDLLYAFVSGPPGPFTAGPGFTLGNKGQFWADEFQILAAAGSLTATFGSLPAKSVLAYKPAAGPPPPFVWVMPGLGTATFSMQIPPACGPNDGACSIAIQVCDTSQTPPVCMTAPIGTLSLIKTVSLPTPQVQTIPVVTVTNP